MKEYGIYIRQGSGTPYVIHMYSNIDSAKIKSSEEERQRPYFVDNNFYINKYNISTKLKYFCIKEREVWEWKNYSEEIDIFNFNS